MSKLHKTCFVLPSKSKGNQSKFDQKDIILLHSGPFNYLNVILESLKNFRYASL